MICPLFLFAESHGENVQPVHRRTRAAEGDGFPEIEEMSEWNSFAILQNKYRDFLQKAGRLLDIPHGQGYHNIVI